MSHTLFLSAGGALSSHAATAAGDDRYVVDFTAGSGQTTRWTRLHSYIAHSLPRDRAERDRKLLVYTGPALDDDMGGDWSPRLTLHMESTAPDGAVFVYLEDVDPLGQVRYVTEGQLRLDLQRRVGRSGALRVPRAVPNIQLTRRTADDAGEVVIVEIDLFPHLLSLLLWSRPSRCDRTSRRRPFRPVPGRAGAASDVHHDRDAQRSSAITLPVMPR